MAWVMSLAIFQASRRAAPETRAGSRGWKPLAILVLSLRDLRAMGGNGPGPQRLLARLRSTPSGPASASVAKAACAGSGTTAVAFTCI